MKTDYGDDTFICFAWLCFWASRRRLIVVTIRHRPRFSPESYRHVKGFVMSMATR